jgi:membrane-associated protease RseP (regulator of RpoE activity)
LWVTEFIYRDSTFVVANWFEVTALWGIGLAINLSLVAIHELGHVLAGRIVGLKIAEITIGHWRKLISWQWGTIRIHLRAVPSSGYVMAVPSERLLHKWRAALLFIGGVIAELACIVIVALLPFNLLGTPSTFGDLVLCYSRICVFCMGGLHVIVMLVNNALISVAFGFLLYHALRRCPSIGVALGGLVAAAWLASPLFYASCLWGFQSCVELLVLTAVL